MVYQLHAALTTTLDMCALWAVSFLVVGSLLAVGSCVKRVWQSWRRRVRFGYEIYAAEQTIHGIRRRAIHDLLTAEREYHDVGGGDVIEGTAVEVRR
jgi:hypothetical protein